MGSNFFLSLSVKSQSARYICPFLFLSSLVYVWRRIDYLLNFKFAKENV